MTKTFTTMNKNHQPYTYLVGWSKLKKYYYGVRYGRKANPKNFWVDYFTSSSYVKEYRELYGEPDIIEVRKVFDTPSEAIQWENGVLTRLLKPTNPNRENWLNICIGYGSYSISDECIEKISIARINYIANRTEEQIQRDYEARLRGGACPESRRKISEKAKERFADPEYMKKMRENLYDTPEFRKRLSEQTTAWLSDPERKAEWLKTVQSEEYCEKQKQDCLNRFKDENFKKKWKQAMEDSKNADPDYYTKKSLNSKKSTGNRLVTSILNKINQDDIINMTEEDFCELLSTKIKPEYVYDKEKAILKFKTKKDSI